MALVITYALPAYIEMINVLVYAKRMIRNRMEKYRFEKCHLITDSK